MESATARGNSLERVPQPVATAMPLFSLTGHFPTPAEAAAEGMRSPKRQLSTAQAPVAAHAQGTLFITTSQGPPAVMVGHPSSQQPPTQQVAGFSHGLLVEKVLLGSQVGVDRGRVQVKVCVNTVKLVCRPVMAPLSVCWLLRCSSRPDSKETAGALLEP